MKKLSSMDYDRMVNTLGVKVNVHESTGLRVLNYNQMETPKSDPIGQIARSLVIDEDLNIISRSFDRFFNLNEMGVHEKDLDFNSLRVFEKVDGSIVTVFKHNGVWLYRTRSMIMPTAPVMGFERTWGDLIESCLCWDKLVRELNRVDAEGDNSYIFEVCARENKVVVKYGSDTSFLLAIRNNSNCEYVTEHVDVKGVRKPRSYSFNTVAECLTSVRELKNLEEGFVTYKNGAPFVKIKSPAYIAAHRLRGEGLTTNRIIEMVVTNESSEYLSVFKEDKIYFDKYISHWVSMKKEALDSYHAIENISVKKDFALVVTDMPYKTLMFMVFNKHLSDAEFIKLLISMKKDVRIKMLCGYINLVGCK